MAGRDLARFYHLFGEDTAVFLPVQYKSKACLIPNWQAITYEQTMAPDYQEKLKTGNLGVQLSGDLVSIDTDVEELALLLIRLNPFLADTLQTRGKNGRNFWLRLAGDYPHAIRRFDKTKKFGEWRGGGGYTVVDGVHPAGCNYVIAHEAQPLKVYYPQIAWPEIFDRPELEVPAEGEYSPPLWLPEDMLPEEDPNIDKTVVEGLLKRGNKMIIGGGSKTYKTWTLTDLGLSIACGTSWIRFKCHKARVLYINFEVEAEEFKKRIKAIKAAKGIKGPVNDFVVWPMRGYAKAVEEVIAKLLEYLRERGEHFDVVIWDPLYKIYGHRSENDAGDITEVMNHLDNFSREAGVTNILGNHFSKGNQSEKEAIDRIGGSGVFGRDPDSVLTITRHSEHRCFVVDLILRNHPEVESFGVRWDYPLLRPDDTLAPEELRKPGRPTDFTPRELLELLKNHDDHLNLVAWEKLARQELGMPHATFHRYKKKLLASNLIFKSQISGFWNVVK